MWIILVLILFLFIPSIIIFLFAEKLDSVVKSSSRNFDSLRHPLHHINAMPTTMLSHDSHRITHPEGVMLPSIQMQHFIPLPHAFCTGGVPPPFDRRNFTDISCPTTYGDNISMLGSDLLYRKLHAPVAPLGIGETSSESAFRQELLQHFP